MTPRTFTVPSLDKFPNQATDTDPASVGDSVANLPYADLRSLTRSMLNVLTLLNRHPYRVIAREELMATYQIPCARLVRVRPDRPNNPSSEQMRQLMVEMAYGYKHLINDALNTPNWLKNRRQLTHALYFTAKHLSLELFLSFEAYQCKVSNSWRELMSIYHLAEQQNLHQLPVEDRDQASPANATIDHVLKRIVLLRVLDPCCMVSGEARACFDYFNVLASQAQLDKPGNTEPKPGRYLLDLDGLESPQPLTRDGLPKNPNRYRVFNLFPVSRQVHHHLQEMKLNDAPPPEGLQRMRELDPNLVLKRILRSWHERHERHNERVEAFGWLLCGFGLSAVNHFMCATIEATKTDQAADSGVGEEEVNMVQAANIVNRPARYLRIRCRQVNRSLSGICLHLLLPSKLKPKVGQVLLMQEDTSDKHGAYHVGIVRRRLRIDNNTLEAGIHFIQGRILPIGLRQGGGEGGFQPGLWVDRGKQGMSSLLVPPGHFKSRQELEVQLGVPARWLTVQGQVEETPSFERFRFSF